MVIVAELVKHLIVVQAIVGSSPTFHTKSAYGGIGRHVGLKIQSSERGVPVRLRLGAHFGK